MDKVHISLLYLLSVILIDCGLIETSPVNENDQFSHVFRIPKKQHTDVITTTENLDNEISGEEGSAESNSKNKPFYEFPSWIKDKKYLDSLGIYANLSNITAQYYDKDGLFRDDLFKSLNEESKHPFVFEMPNVKYKFTIHRTVIIVIPVGLICACIRLCCKCLDGQSPEQEDLLSVETETVLHTDVPPYSIPMPATPPKDEPVQCSEHPPPPSYNEAVLMSTGANYSV